MIAEEMITFCEQAGGGAMCTAEMAEASMRQCDRDGDGQVAYEEFLSRADIVQNPKPPINFHLDLISFR